MERGEEMKTKKINMKNTMKIYYTDGDSVVYNNVNNVFLNNTFLIIKILENGIKIDLVMSVDFIRAIEIHDVNFDYVGAK